jgi:hypothetical protein
MRLCLGHILDGFELAHISSLPSLLLKVTTVASAQLASSVVKIVNRVTSPNMPVLRIVIKASRYIYKVPAGI